MGQINVGTGVIHYKSLGEGTPLIILHAMGTDHQAMEAWLEPIFSYDGKWERIYVDLPAHGHSRVDESVKGTEDMLGMLLTFIDKSIGNQKFALLGASFGGYLAQGILYHKHQQIIGQCFLAPALHLTYRKQKTLPKKVELEKDEGLLSTIDQDISQSFQNLMLFQNKSNLHTFIKEVQPGRVLADRKFLASGWRENSYFLENDPLSQAPYNQPTLFILGRHDHICGYEDCYSLLPYFPKASFVILQDAGHMLAIEQREAVRFLTADWLKKLKR